MKSLPKIKAELDRLAAKIAAPESLLPTYGHSEDGARPHIEVDTAGYHYVVDDNGRELRCLTTSDLDELLFNIFRDIAFEMACNDELKNRIETEDVRRILYRRQLELLSMIFPHWSEREREIHEKGLRTRPFDDYAIPRVKLGENYEGHEDSPERAGRKACERYLLPDWKNKNIDNG